jgi:hypothetical protein
MLREEGLFKHESDRKRNELSARRYVIFPNCQVFAAWEKWEMHRKFWLENLKGRGRLED